jgi:hypothetical protein
MITIKGTVSRFPRQVQKAPVDGVHRANKEGNISGAKAHTIGNMICPHGTTAFMCGDLKVFYGLKTGKAVNKISVLCTRYNQKILHEYGLALNPGQVITVKLKLDGCYGKVNTECYAFKTEICPLSERLIAHFRGEPYKWEDGDNPEAFLLFVDRAERVIKKNMPNIATKQYLKDVRRIGNILWHEDHKRYYIVDCS